MHNGMTYLDYLFFLYTLYCIYRQIKEQVSIYYR